MSLICDKAIIIMLFQLDNQQLRELGLTHKFTISNYFSKVSERYHRNYILKRVIKLIYTCMLSQKLIHQWVFLIKGIIYIFFFLRKIHAKKRYPDDFKKKKKNSGILLWGEKECVLYYIL